MKKLILVAGLVLGTNLMAMDVADEITSIKGDIDFLTTLAQGSTLYMAQQSEKDASMERKIDKLAINFQTISDDIKSLYTKIHQLKVQIKTLKKSAATKPEGAVKILLAHPATWFGLIAVYYLASTYYHYRKQKQKNNNDTTDAEDQKTYADEITISNENTVQ